jgi:hypothetical protein
VEKYGDILDKINAVLEQLNSETEWL